ncbi:hypothetical protein M514_02658 [Trichuris suis]|uniref:Uncharacterized protein n=1 Tax=Trichuris suis TaxID=68888 RepID=A0A085NNN8_9BILA|nr:hypothetical protein M513_02658 [Trichuris suis]KFD71084.1 hypothetical protein M514_02658 [Trichuris suis]
MIRLLSPDDPEDPSLCKLDFSQPTQTMRAKVNAGSSDPATKSRRVNVDSTAVGPLYKAADKPLVRPTEKLKASLKRQWSLVLNLRQR